MNSKTSASAVRGIAENDRRKIAEALSRGLADTYTLYLKTQNFHWNVTGPNFFALHKAFESQYEELAEAADLLAERIRAVTYPVTATLAGFQRLTSVKEDSPADAKEMVKSLIAGHEATIASLRNANEIAEQAQDAGTQDLLGTRIREHEKTVWMLRSYLS